jgi:hypothetical protein
MGITNISTCLLCTSITGLTVGIFCFNDNGDYGTLYCNSIPLYDGGNIPHTA